MTELVEDNSMVPHEKWRYKLLPNGKDRNGKPDPRIEVRKSTRGIPIGYEYAPGRFSMVGGGQLLLTFRDDGSVMFSSNARVQIDTGELMDVIDQVRALFASEM